MPYITNNAVAKDMILWARKSFDVYCALIQDEGYYDKVHQDLANFIQGIVEKPRERYMMIVMARGFLKSTIGTMRYAEWRAGNDPNARILVVSNTDTNAKAKVNTILNTIEKNKIYHQIFPEVIPKSFNREWSPAKAVLTRPGNFQEGTFEAAGTRTKLTGRHYTDIIEDDTVAPDLDDASVGVVLPSPADIQQAIGWHQLAVPLTVDYDTSVRSYIGTRWAMDDAIDYIHKNEPAYTEFNVPAIRNGEPTYPRFNLRALENIKGAMGSFLYHMLYLNDALPSGTMLFKREFLQYFEDSDVPSSAFNVTTIDPAISKKDKSCDTVVLTCSHIPGAMYVQKYAAGHYDPKLQVDIAVEQVKRFESKVLRIEVNAYQDALRYYIEEAFKKEGINCSIDPVRGTAQQNKYTRIMALQAPWEEGRIFMRRDMAELQQQLFRYDGESSGKVDILDALAWQMKSYRRSARPKIPKKMIDGTSMGSVLDELRGRNKLGKSVIGRQLEEVYA